VALGVSVALFVYSRTPGGAAAVGDAVNSAAATVRGIRNNNPMMLRYSKAVSWQGLVGDDGSGYAVFVDRVKGIRAGARTLRTYYSRGLDTVRQIISTYAPQSDNNPTDAYIANVASALGTHPDAPFFVPAALPILCRAIIRQECGLAGSLLVNDDEIAQGVLESA
jgi:hypothetical protein